ncbi:MAG: MFS transporter [Pyrinomonadaceae bacterium]
MSIELDPTQSTETSTTARVTRRVMPFLIGLFVVAFIDRVNVGFAKLEMGTSLGFDSEIFGFGAGIFFFGYFIFEIPGSYLVEVWSARKWLARIIVSWGLVCVLTGFIESANQFYIARFLLGVAEAGFFPGVIVYLSHWFRYQDRAKAVAMFMAAVPVANIVGGPISGFILGLNWLGLEGWRWVFILEGIPALILGVATLFYLTDRPKDAKWLTGEQKDWLSTELEKEREVRRSATRQSVWMALTDPKVILLTLTYFFGVTAAYGFNFWLPTIVKGFGFSNLQTALITSLPYFAGLGMMLLIGWSSDRSQERRWHTALPLVAVSTGLFLGASFSGSNTVMAMTMFCVACAGLYSYLPAFWAMPGIFLTEAAAAVAIGLINSVGNLGGFFGPYVVGYLDKQTGSHYFGIIYLSISALVAAMLALSLRKAGLTTAKAEQ